jgi:hypothetical protein
VHTSAQCPVLVGAHLAVTSRIRIIIIVVDLRAASGVCGCVMWRAGELGAVALRLLLLLFCCLVVVCLSYL